MLVEAGFGFAAWLMCYGLAAQFSGSLCHVGFHVDRKVPYALKGICEASQGQMLECSRMTVQIAAEAA